MLFIESSITKKRFFFNFYKLIFSFYSYTVVPPFSILLNQMDYRVIASSIFLLAT